VINNHSVPVYSLFCEFPEKYMQNIKSGITSYQDIARMHRSYREQFHRQIAEFQGENLIISGEDICVLKQTGLLRLKEYLISLSNPEVEFVVIIVIRHPLDWIRSRIQESVKSGRTVQAVFRMLKTSEKSKMLRGFVNKVSAVFDETNIRCLRYEDMKEHKKGLIGAFFDILHMDDSKINIPVNGFFNVSMTYEGVKLLSRISNSFPFIVIGRINPSLSGFSPDLLFAIPGVSYSLPERLNKIVWEAYKNDFFIVCKRFQLPVYDYYKTKRCDDSLKWGINVQKFLIRKISKMPDKVIEIVLNVLMNELMRYKRVFGWRKKLSILAIVIFYTGYLKTNIILRKLKALI
jgi:hypothetical protein